MGRAVAPGPAERLFAFSREVVPARAPLTPRAGRPGSSPRSGAAEPGLVERLVAVLDALSRFMH